MTTIVIPARLKSERVKEKAIADIDGLLGRKNSETVRGVFRSG